MNKDERNKSDRASVIREADISCMQNFHQSFCIKGVPKLVERLAAYPLIFNYANIYVNRAQKI